MILLDKNQRKQAARYRRGIKAIKPFFDDFHSKPRADGRFLSPIEIKLEWQSVLQFPFRSPYMIPEFYRLLRNYRTDWEKWLSSPIKKPVARVGKDSNGKIISCVADDYENEKTLWNYFGAYLVYGSIEVTDADFNHKTDAVCLKRENNLSFFIDRQIEVKKGDFIFGEMILFPWE